MSDSTRDSSIPSREKKARAHSRPLEQKPAPAESRQVKTALLEQEALYRSVIASMAEGVVVHDSSGAIRACNPSAESILGLTADQMMGKTSMDPLWRAVYEDGSPFPGETHPAMHTLATGQTCMNVIMGIYLPDSSLRWITANSQPFFLPGSARPDAVISTFTDVTSHMQAVNQARFQAHLLGEVRQAVMAITLDGDYLYLNPYAEELFGVRSEEVLGQHFTNGLGNINTSAAGLAIRQEVFAAGKWKGEVTLNDIRGNPLFLEATVGLFKHRNGQAAGYIIVTEEISLRKQVEADLHQLNASLEQRVQDRTAELNETNRRLREKITELEQAQNVLNAVAAGACGYILKDDIVEHLGEAIEAAALGGSYFSPSLLV